jgi:hypothetical protein
LPSAINRSCSASPVNKPLDIGTGCCAQRRDAHSSNRVVIAQGGLCAIYPFRFLPPHSVFWPDVEPDPVSQLRLAAHLGALSPQLQKSVLDRKPSRACKPDAADAFFLSSSQRPKTVWQLYLADAIEASRASGSSATAPSVAQMTKMATHAYKNLDEAAKLVS